MKVRGYNRGLNVFSGIFLCLVFILSLSSSPAHALPAFNITSSPLPIELIAFPGQTVTADLRVQNSGTDSAKIKVSLLKFKASGTNGQPQLLPRQAGDDFFDWVSFSKTSFIANPNIWNTVTMTIKTPSDSAFGYYYAVVFSQDSVIDTVTATPTSKLNGAAATLVLLNVQSAGEKKKVEVASFYTSKKLYEYLPVTFNVAVKNVGNIHLVPRGSIYISRDHKKTIAVIDVNPNAGNTLPSSTRAFSVAWSDGFPVYDNKLDSNGSPVNGKDGKPILKIKYDFSKTNKLRFGKYYAHLTLIYDNGTADVPIEGEVSFWVVPWKMLPVFILAVIMIGVGLYSTSGTWIRWFKKKFDNHNVKK